MALKATYAAITVTSIAPTASTTRRIEAGSMSTKNATPRFSARASALAAPKKLDPTIRPRATSSAHSTGALNRKRSSTETQTTPRSETSRIAATASLVRRSEGVIRGPPLDGGGASDIVVTSSLRRADHVHHGLRLGARLDEILALGGDALAERLLVAFDDGDALVGEVLERFLLHLETVRPGIGRGLPGGVEETFAQLWIHPVEGRVAEVCRQRREIMLGQRVVLRGLVELAGENGRRIMLQPVEHAGLQGRVDFAERQRRRGGAHQASTFGDNRIRQCPDLEASQIFRAFYGLLRQHAARAESIGPGDDADIGALEQSVLDRLGGAGVERLGLLRKTGEEITEVEGANQRHQIGRDRRARHHQVDDAELDRIDDVDFLTELVVGQERDLDLLAETVRLQAFDQVVVVDAAIGVFGIVRKRRRTFEFQRGGLRAPDQGRCCGKPGGCGDRRSQNDATIDRLRPPNAPPVFSCTTLLVRRSLPLGSSHCQT